MTTSSRVAKLAATSPQIRETVWLEMALDRKRAGRRLAALREAQRLTQDVLAERTGISKRTIQRVENGHNLPRYSNLDSLSTVLGDEVYDIFREAGVEPEVSAPTPNVFAALDPKRADDLEKSMSEIKELLREILKRLDNPPPPDSPPRERRRPPKRR